MARFSKIQVMEAIGRTGMVPVFYNPDPEVAKQVVKACYDGGVRAFEFTNRGDFALEVFIEVSRFVAAECPEMAIGAGTIIDAPTAAMYIQYGGKLPTIIMNRTGMDPYAARMKAMLMFAFVPLLVLLAQPLGTISPWFPIVIIGLGCAAHQSWSANIFSVVGDMFPKSAVATVTGVGGMAGGIGSMIMQWFAGWLFVYAEETDMLFLGFEGKPAGYFIVFCICAFSYLAGWVVMKALVPKYKPIETN